MVRVILASGMVAVGMWSRSFLRQGLGAAFAACLVFGSPFVTGSARADTGLCAAPQGPAQYPDKFDWNGSYLFGDLNGVRSKGQQADITLCSHTMPMFMTMRTGGLKQGPPPRPIVFLDRC
jgi:porin